MSNARNLARLIVDSGGDVDVSSLGNVPPSNDASALTTGTLAVNRLASGTIVNSRTYKSGTDTGTAASTSWGNINIGGTGADTYRFSGNTAYVFEFEKKRSDTHLRIHGSVPYYSPSAGGGIGLRVLISIDNGNNWTHVGDLYDGQGHAWGAGGYGSVARADILPFNYHTESSNNTNVLTKTGSILMVLQGIRWSSTDAFEFNAYSGYPKQSCWTVEEYKP